MDEVIEERFKRVGDENERQNKRLEILEQNVATTQELASSVKELAISRKAETNSIWYNFWK